MRFMILLKADKTTEAGVLPDTKLLTEMGKYNEELVKAGVMQAGEGLQPSSKAVRIKFSPDKTEITEGPFDVKEVVCGFWIFKVNSREEAVEWAKRAPLGDGAEIEIRQIFEAEDLGAEFTPELREREERLRGQIAS